MPDPKQVFVQRIFPHQGLIRSLCGVYFSQQEDQEDAFQDVLSVSRNCRHPRTDAY